MNKANEKCSYNEEFKEVYNTEECDPAENSHSLVSNSKYKSDDNNSHKSDSPSLNEVEVEIEIEDQPEHIDYESYSKVNQSSEPNESNNYPNSSKYENNQSNDAATRNQTTERVYIHKKLSEIEKEKETGKNLIKFSKYASRASIFNMILDFCCLSFCTYFNLFGYHGAKRYKKSMIIAYIVYMIFTLFIKIIVIIFGANLPIILGIFIPSFILSFLVFIIHIVNLYELYSASPKVIERLEKNSKRRS